MRPSRRWRPAGPRLGGGGRQTGLITRGAWSARVQRGCEEAKRSALLAGRPVVVLVLLRLGHVRPLDGTGCELSLQRREIGALRAVLELARHLGLLRLGSAAPHGSTPS